MSGDGGGVLFFNSIANWIGINKKIIIPIKMMNDKKVQKQKENQQFLFSIFLWWRMCMCTRCHIIQFDITIFFEFILFHKLTCQSYCFKFIIMQLATSFKINPFFYLFMLMVKKSEKKRKKNKNSNKIID